MRTLICSLLLLATSTVFAQSFEEEFLAGPEWFEGSVLTNSGTEIKGLVKYSDKTDIVCVETGRETKSYTARHLRAFEFYDAVAERQRVFYSVAVEDRIQNVKRPLFFEVVLESKEFALMSKIAPIRVEKREYSTPAMFNPATGAFSAGRYYGYPSTISYTETLFIFSKEGDIRPLLEIKEKDIDGMFFDRSVVKNKFIDEDALKNYTSPFYNKLVDYARANELNMKQKKDLIAVLEYYNKLIQ
jgi:hypothetical protein